MSKSVRLKAYNPRAGFVLRRYTYRGIRFEEGKGWYKVPDDVASYLVNVRNNERDEHSPKAFDVKTHEEAARITEQEYRTKVSQGRVSPGDAPIMVPRETTDQVRRPRAVDDDYPEEDLNADTTTADLARGTSRAKPAAKKKAAASRKRPAPAPEPDPEPPVRARTAKEPRERSMRAG